jgi:nucleotidyltransferase substrate binding protein (TIGR01987 family)
MIDYDKLRKSLKHLELQYANHNQAQDRPELTDIDREAIAESVIQRFETCYDTLWKILRRYLIEESGLAEVPSSPKPLLKLAGQNDLFTSSVEQWLKYADARTSTAHDYSGEKSAEVLLVVGDFIDDAIGHYQPGWRTVAIVTETRIERG